jgi:PAS domain S-box-containing protein
MHYPNLSFHVHQILSALQDVTNHLVYLPDRHREIVSASLHQLNNDLSELVTEIDAHTEAPSLADEYTDSDKTVNVAPFGRSETIEIFNQFIAMNADGTITYINPIAFDIFGQSDPNLKGKMIWEAFPDLMESPLYATFQSAVETRLPAHIEMEGIHNRWYEINIHPTRGGVILYWSDITARKAIEQALQETEERFQLALETAPINVFTLDKHLRYVWVGPRRDVFYHQPVIGKRDDEVLPAQDAAILMEAEQYVIDTGKGLRKEVRFNKKEQPLIYSMALEPLFDRAHQVVGLTIAVMDVTEQRRLEAEKQEAAVRNELQRRLIERSEQERVSLAQELHDGPIQSLVGLGFSIQILKDILRDNPANSEGELDQIGADLKEVVVEVRNICAELRPPVLVERGLQQAIKENNAEVQAKHAGIQIMQEFSADPLHLPAPTTIGLYRIYQQALNNILRHAHASEVSIQMRHDAEYLVLEIKDNGVGFPEPFDWVQHAREGHLGVIGMQERAEAIGGTLQILTKSGEGTMVQVSVPCNGPQGS